MRAIDEEFTIDTSTWEEKFKSFYPSCNVTVTVEQNYEKITIEVTSTYSELPINLAKLMEVGKLFGTLDFDVNPSSEHESWAFSSYTAGTDHTYHHTFVVLKENLNKGLPWETK